MYWSCKFALKRHPLAVRQWWDLESRSTIICATLPARSLGDHGWSLLTTPMPLLWISHHHRTLMKSLLGKGGNGSKPLCCSVFEAVEFLGKGCEPMQNLQDATVQPLAALASQYPIAGTGSLGLDESWSLLQEWKAEPRNHRQNQHACSCWKELQTNQKKLDCKAAKAWVPSLGSEPLRRG